MINREVVLSVYIIFALITAGFIGILIIEGVSDEGGVEATTIIVDKKGGGDYTTISSAVSSANNGDTIHIWEGQYSEYFVITKSIKLIGNGTGNTTIFAKQDQRITYIDANDVEITGINFTSLNTTIGDLIKVYQSKNLFFHNNNFFVDGSWLSSYGIYLEEGDNIIIENNTVLGKGIDGSAIYFKNSNGNQIRNNTLYYCTTNIRLNVALFTNVTDNKIFEAQGSISVRGAYNRIEFNEIHGMLNGTSIGISLGSSTYCRITNNNMTLNGLSVSGTYSLTFRDHFVTHTIDSTNTLNNKPVYFWKNQTNRKIPANAGQVILYNCKDIDIEDQDFTNVFSGSRIIYSNRITIKNSIFKNNLVDPAINTYEMDDSKIEGNTLINNEGSISLSYSNKNIILNNSISYDKSPYGILISNSHINNITNNICSQTSRILITHSNDNFLYKNNLTTGSRLIDISYSDKNEVIGNIISNSYSDGMWIFDSDFNIVKNNIFEKNNNSGLFLILAQGNTVINNTCNSNNENGIWVEQTTRNNRFEQNTCSQNGGNGLQLSDSASLSYYRYNTFTNNKENGVYFNSPGSLIAKDNIFENNNISNNKNGTNLYSGFNDLDGNIFFGNMISGNTNYGIYLDTHCTNNEFYHNNLISNGQQAAQQEANKWNNDALEGNYWSDYTGADDGSGTGKHTVAGDGIGDTKLPHLGLDNYPYMKKFGWNRPGIPTLTTPESVYNRGDFILYWDTVEKASRFKLEEDTTSNFINPVVVYDGTNLNATISKSESGSYYYRVRAYNEYVDGNWSNIVQIIIDLPPSCPAGLEVGEITDHEIELTWQANNEIDLEGYRILINDTGANASGPFKTIKTVSASITTTIIFELAEETTYYFAVVAYDLFPSDSESSNVVSATTLDWTAPGAPTGLAAEAVSSSDIQLVWNANPDPDTAGYIIFINDTGEDADGNFHPINKLTGNKTSWKATGFDDDTTYYFRIKAFDEKPNNSSFSDAASATTFDATPPSAPENPVVRDPTNQSLTISWDGVPDLDVIGYLVYRSPTSSGTFTSVAHNIIRTTEFIDSGLEEDTIYFYKIKSIDDANLTSDFSPITSGKTLLGQKPPMINNSKVNFEIPEDAYDDRTINLYRWFVDPNGDKLDFECKGQDKIWVFIYPDNGTVILRPKKDWNGFEALTFYASDEGGTAKISIVITVTAVNDPPVNVEILAPESGLEVKAGQIMVFEGTADDPDLEYNDVLSYEWSSDISGVFGNEKMLTGITLPAGKHQITLTVTDKEGLSATATISITIKEDGTAPADKNDDKDDNGKYSNLIALILIGIVIGIVLIVIIFFILRKRGRGAEGPELGSVPETEKPPEQQADSSQPPTQDPTVQTNAAAVPVAGSIPLSPTAEVSDDTDDSGGAMVEIHKPGEDAADQPVADKTHEQEQITRPTGSPQQEDQPQPEQAPADQGAVQLVDCPTCGTQIAPYTTPCPSCNTILNWGAV